MLRTATQQLTWALADSIHTLPNRYTTPETGTQHMHYVHIYNRHTTPTNGTPRASDFPFQKNNFPFQKSEIPFRFRFIIGKVEFDEITI